MALIKIASLWKNTTKDGMEYYSGYLGDAKILIMENSNRDADKKHPTHNLLISEKDQHYREKKVAEYNKSQTTYDNSVTTGKAKSSVWDDDSDIPF